jgi:hypothetical protein
MKGDLGITVAPADLPDKQFKLALFAIVMRASNLIWQVAQSLYSMEDYDFNDNCERLGIFLEGPWRNYRVLLYSVD